jgi:hypothetical protein
MIQLLYACFLSVWRRCFGCSGWELPIIKHRVIQHIIGALACFGICLYNDYHWIQAILCSVVLQGLYWARAHGEFFDYGHSNPVNVARYEKEWWWKFVKKIMPESVYYSFTCDFICMTVRYTLPAILCGLVLFNIPVMFMGLVLSCVYALMWKFHDWYGLKNPTNISEWIVGFITGLFIGG